MVGKKGIRGGGSKRGGEGKGSAERCRGERSRKKQRTKKGEEEGRLFCLVEGKADSQNMKRCSTL